MARFIQTVLALTAGFLALAATTNAATAAPPDDKIVRTEVLPGGYNDTFTVTIGENKPTIVKVTGSGVSRLELRVTDPAGNPIASDTFGDGDVRNALFITRSAGRYKIQVKNSGVVDNKYTIVID